MILSVKWIQLVAYDNYRPIETYRARRGKITEAHRHTYDLLSIKQPHPTTPLLPVLPNSPPNTLSLLTSSFTAGESSPTASSSHAPHPDLELSAQLQRLEGPWNLFFDMPIPPRNNSAGLHFSFERETEHGHAPLTPIEVKHELLVQVQISTALSSSGSGAEKEREESLALAIPPPVSNADFETIEIRIPVELLSVGYPEELSLVTSTSEERSN